MKTFERLRRRGQFFLGPPSFSKVDGWSMQQINAELLLSIHPDLPVCHVQEGDKSLTLVGYLLDPRAPNDTNTDILNRLCTKLWSTGQLDDFPRLTDRFCGRWVIVATSGSEILLVHDAAGQRQVHYAHHDGATYCASQANVIALHLKFKHDPQAVHLRDNVVSKDMGYFWLPGDRSMFAQVRRLLPNHCLNLRSGEVHRYFGTEGIQPHSVEEAVQSASELLRGAFLSARNRFRLALSCSGGFDSRVLMAASQPNRADIFYYSRRHYYRPLRHPDIALPRRLLSRNGLKHHVINMPPTMSEEFASIYRENVDTPHDDWGSMAEGLYRGLPAGAVVVMGTVSQVCRCDFGDIDSVTEVTPNLIAKRVEKRLGLPEAQFTVKAFGEWLSQASFGRGLHPLLDMLYWEQRAGCWEAMWMDELAIAHETIPLYNCRDLLTTLLSVDKQYRLGPDFELYQRMIRHMWPEGLSEPFNPPMPPPSFSEKSVDALKSFVRRSLPDPIIALLKKHIRH